MFAKVLVGIDFLKIGQSRFALELGQGVNASYATLKKSILVLDHFHDSRNDGGVFAAD